MTGGVNHKSDGIRTLTHAAIGFAACVFCLACSARGGSIGDFIWNDVNRNGLQDPAETGWPGVSVSLYSSTTNLIASTTSDSNGFYQIAGPSNGLYFLKIMPVQGTRFSTADEGADDDIDSDVSRYYVSTDVFSYTGQPITNLDAGIYFFEQGMDFSVQVNGYASDNPVYVTNGAWVTYSYSVSNAGETLLDVYIYDDHFPEFLVASDNCIDAPSPASASKTYTAQLEITGSITNVIQIIAFSNDAFLYGVNDLFCCACFQIPYLDPMFEDVMATVIVVTNDPLDFADGDLFPNWWEMQYGLDPLNSNAPGTNSDSDWMTDYEEYIADTNPTNTLSLLPDAVLDDQLLIITESSTSRVYSVWWNTNLLVDPQPWTLYPPEQNGTGAPILFTITNAAPEKMFRTGVRLP